MAMFLQQNPGGAFEFLRALFEFAYDTKVIGSWTLFEVVLLCLGVLILSMSILAMIMMSKSQEDEPEWARDLDRELRKKGE